MSVVITSSMVKELRSDTDLPMMACKRALVEAEGDYKTAFSILKEKSAKKALTRIDREVREGYIASYISEQGSVLISLRCETDFSAKSDEFIKTANDIAFSYFMADGDRTHLDDVYMAVKDPNNPNKGKRVCEVVEELSAKIGEKVEVSDFSKCGINSDKIGRAHV